MEILKFIFKNVWTFSGTIILIAVTFEGIEKIARHFRKR